MTVKPVFIHSRVMVKVGVKYFSVVLQHTCDVCSSLATGRSPGSGSCREDFLDVLKTEQA